MKTTGRTTGVVLVCLGAVIGASGPASADDSQLRGPRQGQSAYVKSSNGYTQATMFIRKGESLIMLWAGGQEYGCSQGPMTAPGEASMFDSGYNYRFRMQFDRESGGIWLRSKSAGGSWDDWWWAKRSTPSKALKAVKKSTGTGGKLTWAVVKQSC